MSPTTHSPDPTEKKRKLKTHPRQDDHPSKKAKKAVKPNSDDVSVAKHGAQDLATKKQSVSLQIDRGSLNGTSVSVDNHEEVRLSGRQRESRVRSSPSTEGLSRSISKGQKSSKHRANGVEEHGAAQAVTAKNTDFVQSSAVATRPPKTAASQWHLSEPIGGRFRLLDPCFSLDERFMMLATRRNLNIYSLSSSILLHRIAITTKLPIVALQMSQSNPELVFIATADGTVTLVDWLQGTILRTINYGCHIVALSLAAVAGVDADTLYLIIKSSTDSVSQSHLASIIFTHRQEAEEQANLEQLSSTYNELEHLQVLDGGRVIFAASKTTVLMGWSPRRRGKAYNEHDEPLKHMWKAMEFPEGLTCQHARYFASGEQTSNAKNNPAKGNTFSLAIGSAHGAIFIYDDILEVFRGQQLSFTKPRKLHWHRNAVGALKWSLDGNYLISGGQETVLVIWQLETNRRQDLPHLTAHIQRITVSPSGTSYALQLADNSVIVLSTSELAPKAIISGLQSKCAPSGNATFKSALSLQTAVVESNLTSNQILLAVPASVNAETKWKTPRTPFLETFDLLESRHISRQALTRNNTVILNQAPTGQPIEEANIYALQLSSDGLWLATIEEWSPPSVDVHDIIGTAEFSETQQEMSQRRESYLKFWQWDDSKQQWNLHARFDSPHRVDWEPEHNRIINIVALCDGPGYATIGEDGIVKIWTTKSRLRDGRIVRGIQAEGQTTWICSAKIEIEKVSIDSDRDEDQGRYEVCRRASLSFSRDGTVLAVSLNNKRGLVHLYDAKTAVLQASLTGIYEKFLIDMRFLGRYLVVLANEIRVWDIISNSLVVTYDLQQGQDSTGATYSLLATNHELNTFAVASTRVIDGIPLSRILVFSPTSADPVFAVDEPGAVTALIASKYAPGFIILNAEAEIRTIQSATGQRTLLRTNGHEPQPAPITETLALRTSQDNQDVDDATALTAIPDDDDDDNDIDMDRNFVRGNQLAKLFEGVTSHALPPVTDLFHAVAKLYIGKPNA